MATWKVSTQRDSYLIRYVNSDGRATEVGLKPSSTPLVDLLGWIASEMDDGDFAVLDGETVLQKFPRRFEATAS